MNDDALAAVVVAAAALLAARARHVAQPPREGRRWGLAARIRCEDAADARLIARAPSRWPMSGRLRE